MTAAVGMRRRRWLCVSGVADRRHRSQSSGRPTRGSPTRAAPWGAVANAADSDATAVRRRRCRHALARRNYGTKSPIRLCDTSRPPPRRRYLPPAPRNAVGQAQPSRKAATADAALDKLRARRGRSAPPAAAAARAAAQTTAASEVSRPLPPPPSPSPHLLPPLHLRRRAVLDCAGLRRPRHVQPPPRPPRCPPFYGGPDCAAPLFPACATQWGVFKPEVAVCGIHISPPSRRRATAPAVPLALDARQECVVDLAARRVGRRRRPPRQAAMP